MLILKRKNGQRIKIGGCIWIEVLRCHNGAVRLGVEAPRDMPIVREELLTKETPEPESGDSTEESPRN